MASLYVADWTQAGRMIWEDNLPSGAQTDQQLEKFIGAFEMLNISSNNIITVMIVLVIIINNDDIIIPKV